MQSCITPWLVGLRENTCERDKNLPILISTSPSHQDMVWTGKFCAVKPSNITNYSVHTLIETTPWKNEGNWCAAAWQSRTVATRQQFLSHKSCESEFNLPNQPLYIASRTQIYHHPGICALRSAFLGCQHLMHVSGGASKRSRKIDLGLHG